ncbi:hypothetical protein GINT2_000048 [Glugoides intestinalis]
MQRLSSVNRKKEPIIEEAQSLANFPLQINNNILFLISRLIGKRCFLNNCLSRAEHESIKKATAELQIKTPYLVSHDFIPHNKLKSICIKGSHMVQVSCFEGLHLSRLEFDNISNFDIAILSCFDVTSLTFRNSTIHGEKLGKLIEVLAPKALHFDNVHTIKTENAYMETKVYSSIISAEIQCLSAENSFFTEEQFFSIVLRKSLKKFCFINKNSFVKHRSLGQYFSYFVLRNFDISRYLLKNLNWISVDILSIDNNNAVINNICHLNRRLQFLCLDNVCIDSNLVKRLPKLTSVHLNRCTFEGMSFYDFITLQKNSLRYISVMNVDLPLDSISYIHYHNKNCKVKINSTSLG